MQKIVCMFAADIGTTELGPRTHVAKLWKEADKKVDSALQLAFMTDCNAEQFHGDIISCGDLRSQFFLQK